MHKTARLFAIVALTAGVPAAASTEGYSEEFSIAADAIVYASTCEAMGFTVDDEGIASMVLNLQQVAVWDGASEEQASRMMRTAVAEEFERRGEEFQRASLMDHSLDTVERFERRWIKRCDRLATTELTAPYFSR